ncbi:MAG TPA: hypothetical protein VKF42_03410 [Chitinivibrionales bacterium]|jgi:hypothetical protein|nr:hypothetical protein [Chitinivibrionales bacterium]
MLNLLTVFSVIVAALPTLCFGSIISNSVSQDSLYIGDRVHLGVTLVVPPGSQITPPATDNGFGTLSVKEWTSDKTEKKNADSVAFHYAVTTYTAEPCTIPALDFYVTKEKTSETLRTQPVPLRVLLVSSPDTASIKDLKPQQSAGRPSLAWLWIVLGICALIATVVLGRRVLSKAAKPVPEIPRKPPYEEAIAALAFLEAKNYLASGMIREYAFELSEIVKRYIERRFEINAAEFTTYEMLEWVKRSPLKPADRNVLDWFFSTTDPVKFAKWLPDNDTANRFGLEARAFVERTRPLPSVDKSSATVPPAAGQAPAGRDHAA